MGDDEGRLERPAEVVQGAGVWLAGRLAARGFGWRASAGTLERRDGDRRERVHLHGSAWNRAGGVIAFQVMVTVADRRVRAWRRAHPDLTLDPDGSDRVCGHPLVMLTGSAERAQVDLTDPGSRRERLDAFAEVVQEVVLPWFARTREPRPERFDEPTVRSQPVSLAEWLVSLGLRERAGRLFDRWLELEPSARDRVRAGAEAAYAGARPLTGDDWAAIGWTRATLGLT